MIIVTCLIRFKLGGGINNKLLLTSPLLHCPSRSGVRDF